MKPIKNNLPVVFLFAILSLGAFLRFYKIAQNPNGFYVDEAVIGYNAYSILKTGKDEFGKAFPIFLRSYGAYSSPLYVYLSALSIALFGLNEFSVRFSAALSGTLSILLIYLILKEMDMFKNKGFELVGAFLFCITPWNLFFSRGAYEASLALFLFLLSFYLMLLSKKQSVYLILSLAVLSLSSYTYQAQRLISLLLLPIYLYYPLQNIKLKEVLKMQVIHRALMLFILIQIPQIMLINTPAFRLRAAGLFYQDQIVNQAEKLVSVFPRYMAIPISFLREFSSYFVSYFSPANLFLRGDADVQRSYPELSVFYSWMVVPYVVGIFYLIKYIKMKNIQLIVFLSFIFAATASLTRDPFSALRSYALVFPLIIAITLGLEKMYINFPRKIMFIALLIALAVSAVSVWRSVFVLFPKERAAIWGYGYKELANIIKQNNDSHFVVDQSRLKPTYIIFAFHLTYPPNQMQKLMGVDIAKNYYTDTNANTNIGFANIENRNIEWDKDIYKRQVLVGDALAVSEVQAKEHFLKREFEIKDPLGNIIFVGYKTQPDKKCKADFNLEFCDKL